MAFVKIGVGNPKEATIKAVVLGKKDYLTLNIKTPFNELVITLTDQEQRNLNKAIALNFNQ